MPRSYSPNEYAPLPKIAIVKREREAERNGILQAISRAVATINVEQFYEILRHIMTLLADGVDKGLVRMG